MILPCFPNSLSWCQHVKPGGSYGCPPLLGCCTSQDNQSLVWNNFHHFRISKWTSNVIQISRGHKWVTLIEFDNEVTKTFMSACLFSSTDRNFFQSGIFLPSITWNTCVWAVTLVQRSFSADLMDFVLRHTGRIHLLLYVFFQNMMSTVCSRR